MKKAIKRSLSLILAITIIFGSAYVGLGEIDFKGIDFSGLFAVKASAASESDLTFTLNSDGQSYSVTDSDYPIGEVIIPSTYNNLPVTKIGDLAFHKCKDLTSITIPAILIFIGVSPFRNALRCKTYCAGASLFFQPCAKNLHIILYKICVCFPFYAYATFPVF